MKYLIVNILIFINYGFCVSQDTLKTQRKGNSSPRFAISFGLGQSASFGLYTLADQTGNWSGGECADIGIAIAFNLDYRFKKQKLELTCTLGYNRNKYDINNFENFEYQRLNINISNGLATQYDIFYFLPGIKYPFRFWKFEFSLNANAGIVTYQSPYISYSENYLQIAGHGFSKWNVTQSSAINSGLGIFLGANIKYYLVKNIFISVNVMEDFYSGQNIAYAKYESTEPPNLPQQFSGNITPVDIQIGNLLFGAGFEF